MLTRTNYLEWALVMEVNFQTLRVWDAVHHGISDDPDEDEYHDDRQAMSGLLRSVPSELWGTLATKDTVKQAWDATRTLRIGDERARDASAQQLRRDFANLTFKEGESVTDFGVRITALATNLRTLGDNITDTEIVKKLLQVVPRSLNQAAVSIKMFMDLNKTTIKNVIGRLRVFEERDKPPQITDAIGRLVARLAVSRRALVAARDPAAVESTVGVDVDMAVTDPRRGMDAMVRARPLGTPVAEVHHVAPAVIVVAKRATGPRTAMGRRRVRLMSRRPRRTSMR
jgi:hypothetical protein